MTRFLPLLLLSALLACGSATLVGVDENQAGNTGGAGGAAPGGSTACDRLAEAFCARLESCDYLSFHHESGQGSFSFKDGALCQERVSLACAQIRAIPQTAIPDARVDACASALQKGSCGSFRFYSDARLSVCDWGAGLVANGGPCEYDFQCSSQRCGGGDVSCGTCAPTAELGQACGPSVGCKAGSLCWKGTCQTRGVEGSPCDKDGPPCLDPLSCQGTCQKSPKGCSGCDAAQGTICNPSAGMCEALKVAGENSSCGPVGGELSKSPTVCDHGLGCLGQNDFGAGSCKRLVREGEACAYEGPGCLFPASCEKGTCRLLTASCP